MPMIQYPFIDIAVHEKVRPFFAGGEAVVLFSPNMEEVLWASGRGAALFGYSSVYDFLDQGPLVQDLLLRQIKTGGQTLRDVGDITSLTIRVAAGFRRVTVTGSCALLEICGERVVLFHAPIAQAPLSIADRARSMIEGLDDPETHLAVIDGDGEVIASSAGYGRLAITPQTARMLVTMSGSDTSLLVKRPVPTAEGYLPAAMAKVCADPALHLLFIVEAAAPGVEQGPTDDDTELAQQDPQIVEARVPQEFEDAIDAVSHLEEPQEATELVDLELPQGEADTTLIDTQPDDILPAAPAVEPVGPSPYHLSDEPQLVDVEPTQAVEEVDVTDFVFRRDARATRFVWKIDADGRFCEVSEEFAQTVGPHAADINGMVFSEVASLFHLDPDGKIAELLSKRDTWSGKTIWWPVEGTSLAVPIDLAALPTYTRARTFDGFRGFGIIRVGDAVEHSHAVGLTLGPVPPAAQETADLFAVDEPFEDSDVTGTSEGQDTDAENADPTSVEEVDVVDEAPATMAQDELIEVTVADQPSIETNDPLEWPKGERPALRLVGNQLEASDKVIPLDNRRNRRESLSPVEQAAFREIARQLDTFIGRSDQEDVRDLSANESQSAETRIEEAQPIERVTPPAETGEQIPEPVDAEIEFEPEEEADPAVETADAADADGEQAEVRATDELVLDQPEDQTRDDVVRVPLHRERDGLSAEILNQMPVALLVHAGDRLIHGNPEFLRLTGYASIDALAEVGGLDALLQRQDLEGKTVDAGGMVVVRADDLIVPVTARLQSVRFDQATALMLALMPVAGEQTPRPDAVDEKVVPLQNSRLPEQNARLQVEVDELRAILETATDGVVVIESDGNIRSMNGAASALFNYDSVEAAGKPFVMLFAHESQRAIVDYLAGLSGHGVASVLNDGREVIGREASGGFIPLFMTIGKLTSSNGYCAVIRDITQWKRTEEELRAAKRSAETANAHKSEFLAHVSHEIRTPLNAIIGFADLMATERFGPVGHPRYMEYASDIVRSGRHVLDIVNDLLDISKIEAGEMELDFVSVELNSSVSEAVSLVQPQANSQRVIIRTALSNAVPPVVADHRSVKQIVLNILSNAIRFTPPGGQIVVSTVYEPNGYVVLRVRDTGIGMTRQELETAMKPFRQVAGGTRKRGEGTGLGLPLTKAMVDANRANFSIQSTPREGTLVEISFPPQRVLAN